VRNGIPFLGFRVYPGFRRLKRRNGVAFASPGLRGLKLLLVSATHSSYSSGSDSEILPWRFVVTVMTVQIRRKGAITLPVELRRRYGLGEGDVFTVVDLGDGSILLTSGGISSTPWG